MPRTKARRTAGLIEMPNVIGDYDRARGLLLHPLPHHGEPLIPLDRHREARLPPRCHCETPPVAGSKQSRLHSLHIDNATPFQRSPRHERPARKLAWPGAITMELGCGRADFLLQLAERNPDKLFVGVDKKAARLWAGAQAAIDRDLHNCLFLRSEIEYLPEVFEAGTASDISLMFPDPYPQFGKARKRLTAPRFIKVYRYLLTPGGRVHLKTDSERLFKYTLGTLRTEKCALLAAVDDVYASAPEGVLALQTPYERRHIAQGCTIRHICFAPNSVAHSA